MFGRASVYGSGPLLSSILLANNSNIYFVEEVMAKTQEEIEELNNFVTDLNTVMADFKALADKMITTPGKDMMEQYLETN